MRRNDRLDKKLRAAAAGDLGLGRRLAGLVVENGEPATGEPVDPVGPRAKGHVTGRCGQINAALDLGMACLDAGAAAGLGLDEPCRDGLEGGPPEMADGRMLPVRVKHGARQRPEFGKRIVRKRTLRKGPQERRQRVMHQIAAERRIDRPVQIVLRAQLQNTLGVDRIGVGDPVIDLGGGKAAGPRIDRRRRTGARQRRHRRGRKQRRQLVTPSLTPIDCGGDAQRLGHGIEPLAPAARRGDGIAVAQGAGDDHLGRAGRHPHIMRAQSGPPVMRLQPGRVAHLGIGPGVDLRPWWPVALVEPAKDQAVGALHARLDRAEDGQTRMGLPGPADRFSGKKLRQDSRETVTVRLETASLFGKRRQKQRSGLAILASPQMHSAVRCIRRSIFAGRLRRHLLRRIAKRPCQRGKVRCHHLPCLDQAGEWHGNRGFEKFGNIGISGFAGELATNAVEAGAWPVPAESRHLELPNPLAKGQRRNASGCKGMLQEGKGRHRREVGRQHGDKTFQIAAGRTLRQRPAGRIIHLDPPALQRRDHRLGKLPVRRHQRGCPAGSFQHLAHGKGDDRRLVGPCFTINEGQPVKRVATKLGLGRAKLPPVSRQRRRLEHLAHQRTPPRADLPAAGKIGPVAHRLRRHRQAVEQNRQLVLRMAGFLAHQIPVFRRPPIQPRQHDMPVRQVGNGGDQFTRGGKGTGRSGDHHQLFGRMVAPQPAAQPDKPVAPVGGVDHTLLFKDGRPAVDQDGQQFQYVLPVP